MKKIEKQDRALYEKPTEYTMKERDNFVYCPKCKHTVEFWHGEDRVCCTWCGKWCYKDKKIEFKYKALENLKKVRNES